jgi:CheY-like chemotaxis protein
VLQHLGYTAFAMAENGMVALEMIEKTGLPDLILMDVQMYVKIVRLRQ